MNGISFGLLWAHRGTDANMRSAWICTRNDVLGNLAVLLAALGVFGTGIGWPDVIVATRPRLGPVRLSQAPRIPLPGVMRFAVRRRLSVGCHKPEQGALPRVLKIGHGRPHRRRVASRAERFEDH